MNEHRLFITAQHVRKFTLKRRFWCLSIKSVDRFGRGLQVTSLLKESNKDVYTE